VKDLRMAMATPQTGSTSLEKSQKMQQRSHRGQRET
jgi:hypothetical protein